METQNKIGIVVDATADLPADLVLKNSIKVVELKFDYQQMKDLVGTYWERIREAQRLGINSLIKTSQPSPGEFVKAFKEQLEKFEKVVCITLSSKVSGTYNCAVQAANFLDGEMRKRVEVIDSLNGSGAVGALVFKIQQMAQKDLSISEIIAKTKQSVSRLNLLIGVPNCQRLIASGRVPAFVGAGFEKAMSMNIWPLLGVKFGRIIPIAFKRNTKNLVEALSKEFTDHVSKFKSQEKINVFISHGDDLPAAQSVKEAIEKTGLAKVQYINYLTPVLGGHAGLGSVTVGWEDNN